MDISNIYVKLAVKKFEYKIFSPQVNREIQKTKGANVLRDTLYALD